MTPPNSKPVANNLGPYVSLWDKLDDPAFVASWQAVDQWVNDGIPFAGEAYRQWIKDFYQQNKLVKGELVIGDQTVEGWEGCLSIPDIRGRVPRAQHVKVSALDRTGKRFELDLTDFPARVVQHENDHLDGVLFFDRMRSLETLTYLEEYSRYHAKREKDDDDGPE